MTSVESSAIHREHAQTGHVCIVDDDQALRDLLSTYLSRHGLRVGTFEDGNALRRFLARGGVPPDMVILDVMLPTEDGLSICRWLKTETDLPVLMLSGRGDEVDRILGLELGADDYVCKPFSPRELLARIRNLLRLTRRSQQLAQSSLPRKLCFHGWTLDTGTRTLTGERGVEIRLSGCEYLLLHALASNSNKVLSRSRLSLLVHGRELQPHDRSIDVLVSRIRVLLGDSARDAAILRTVYGRGYLLTGGPARL